jgi:flavin reductase (DIM6/NTAB) family NADH-FMN oxidoreductase RutF
VSASEQAPSRAPLTAQPSRNPVTPAVPVATFAELMAELPAGVAVITTATPDMLPLGILVTSMGAYTADPPSVMVSISHASRCHEHLLRAEHFGVHILHIDQASVAEIFAARVADKFTDLRWAWDDDVPRVENALAYLRCRRTACFDHLDHTILIGTINRVERTAASEPMLYLRRRFDWTLRNTQTSNDASIEWPAWFDSDFEPTTSRNT